MSKYTNQYYIDETFDYKQVVRWNSNDTVPPKDILAELCVTGHITTEMLYDSIDCKNKEDAAFLEEYVARRQKYGYSDEEKFEMQAAFGNEQVVDIFTGEVVQYA
jgi:hypothetical protein